MGQKHCSVTPTSLYPFDLDPFCVSNGGMGLLLVPHTSCHLKGGDCQLPVAERQLRPGCLSATEALHAYRAPHNIVSNGIQSSCSGLT